jgi:hypothetical protein
MLKRYGERSLLEFQKEYSTEEKAAASDAMLATPYRGSASTSVWRTDWSLLWQPLLSDQHNCVGHPVYWHGGEIEDNKTRIRTVAYQKIVESHFSISPSWMLHTLQQDRFPFPQRLLTQIQKTQELTINIQDKSHRYTSEGSQSNSFRSAGTHHSEPDTAILFPHPNRKHPLGKFHSMCHSRCISYSLCILAFHLPLDFFSQFWHFRTAELYCALFHSGHNGFLPGIICLVRIV